MAKKPKSTKLSSTIFSLNKRIAPSAGVFYGAKWDNRQDNNLEPLVNQDKTVKGTMSHHIKNTVASDPMKLQKEIEKANIQRIDECALSVNHDTLVCDFSVKFLPVIDGIEACNNPEYLERYLKSIDEYSKNYEYRELAHRYAFNLASGRWLWKNRVGAECIEVIISLNNGDGVDKQWVFKSKSIGTVVNRADDINEMAEFIRQALAGERSHVNLMVRGCSLLGTGQVVYPSQEFIQEKNSTEGAKNKVLYSKNGIAGIHDQKIGNAIRTIDTWYPNYDEYNRIISIEVYGSVTALSKVFRSPVTGTDYHNLMLKMIEGEEMSEDELHYIHAMFIRGGVLGTEK
ncbi:type I-F CRISPR-associated protein Csy3 [Vibrio metschnikovii]|nr:type I-F CRISPR-associated protein Csy3 [Vibrio metschnikovii]